MKIQFDQNQVNRAADFIFKNNPSYVQTWNRKSADEVAKDIVDHMRETDPNNSWSSTGGWILVITKESDNRVNIDVFVDPAVMDPIPSGSMTEMDV